MAYTEDERRSLRTDDAHRGESKTVLPDGSYSTGPRLLRGLTRARVEHCLVCAAFKGLGFRVIRVTTEPSVSQK